MEQKQISIAEARNDLPSVVHDVEAGALVKLTRRGKPVAVIISIPDYERLAHRSGGFSAAYDRFLQTADLETFGLPDEFFDDLRDRTPGREIDL